MTATLISARGISKSYRLYDEPFDRVKEALNPFGRQYHRVFDALSDVTFDLQRGQSLGVIGKNGHGKSTLLKIVSGLLPPTRGELSVRGRVAAILEVSSNLNPEVSGLKNVEFGLRIAGVPVNQRPEKLEEITEFSDLGEFIDQPVKNYSSGMRSRLGFALATSVDPDILILDEVLAVGDFEFQQKCLARMNDMRDRMTFLFVSHSMNAVRHFCDNAIVLESGRVGFRGNADDAVEYYVEQQEKRKALIKEERQQSIKPFFGDLFQNGGKVRVFSHGWQQSESTRIHAPIRFEFEFELKCDPRNLIIGVPIWSVETRELVTSVVSDFSDVPIIVRDGRCKGSIEVICQLNPGAYLSSFNIRDGVEYLYRQLNEEFVVTDHRRTFGHFTQESSWRFE